MNSNKLSPYEASNEKILLKYYQEQREKALKDDDSFTDRELEQLDLTRAECRSSGHMNKEEFEHKYLIAGTYRTKTIDRRDLYSKAPWLMVRS